MTVKEILENSFIVGNILELPTISLDRKDYLELKKTLEMVGGKWKGGKTLGFVFDSNPTELIAKLLEENSPNKVKKDYQFFETPHDLAIYLVNKVPIFSNEIILEPSAGQGSIVKAIQEVLNDSKPRIDCYELMPVNQIILKKIEGINFLGENFLEANESPIYDRIIANPPFSNNQDIDHIEKMHKMLIPGGVITSIASKHWMNSKGKKEIMFKNWLESVSADITDIPKGVFKNSGTMVESCLITIFKFNK